ncbi:MAG: hypothetical protein UW70_C0059G0011, partial [Candidatus Peregrinibacteria bacterium GW2011_GWA2_44_7]
PYRFFYSAFRFFRIFFANGSLISVCRGTDKINSMASRKFVLASSIVSPCPLAPGTSGQMAQNPPQNRVEQQIRTVESIALEWENFMRGPENVEIIMGFRKKAAESVYPILSAQIKQVIDQKAENKIYELAQEIAQQDVIDRETAASRSAVLTRAGLPLD